MNTSLKNENTVRVNRNFVATAPKSAAIPDSFKPVKRVSDRRDTHAMVELAVTAAMRDGRDRYLVPTCYGWAMVDDPGQVLHPGYLVRVQNRTAYVYPLEREVTA